MAVDLASCEVAVMDLTYREALNARLAKIYQSPSAEHGERAWGEGETERMEVFLNRTVADVMTDIGNALRSMCESLARGMQSIVDALSFISQSAAQTEQTRHYNSVANRVRPVRVIPGSYMRAPLQDQRPAIRQHYAGRRS